MRTRFAIILFCLLTVLYAVPVLENLEHLGRGDWDQAFFFQEVPQVSVFQYHQFPFWNPYYCGGVSLIGNPQVRFFSPSILFTSIFGVVEGVWIEYIAHIFIGLLGMYFLSHYLGVRGISTFVPSLIFMFNGAWALRFAEGHVFVFAAAYIPYVFLFFLKGIHESKGIIWASAFLSLMFYEGGTYVFIFFVVFLLLYALFLSIQTKQARPLILVIFLLVSVVIFTAPKLFPTLEFLNQHPRLTGAGDFVPSTQFYDFFFSKLQSVYRRFSPSSSTGWWEYGAYIGLLPFLFFMLSFKLYRKYWSLLVVSVLFFILIIGDFSRFSLWSLFHHLPVLRSMHGPWRGSLVFLFVFSLLVGLYLNTLENETLKNPLCKKYVMLGVLFIILFDLLSVTTPVLNEAFTKYKINKQSQIKLGTSRIGRNADFLQIKMSRSEIFRYGAWSSMHHALLRNVGVVNGYEPLSVQRNAAFVGSAGYKGEFFLFPESGSVAMTHWSPNRIKFQCEITKPTTLVVNQNFDWNWRSGSSKPIESYQGLLSVRLNPEDKTIVLYYLPVTFIAGLAVFLIGGVFIFKRFLK